MHHKSQLHNHYKYNHTSTTITTKSSILISIQHISTTQSHQLQVLHQQPNTPSYLIITIICFFLLTKEDTYIYKQQSHQVCNSTSLYLKFLFLTWLGWLFLDCLCIIANCRSMVAFCCSIALFCFHKVSTSKCTIYYSS